MSYLVWIAVVLYRNWLAFRSSSGTDHQQFLTMFIRIVLFTVISMLGVGLSSLSIRSPNLPKPYWTRLILTIVPIIAAVTFGSQEDIVRSCIFWREPLPVPPPMDSSKEADLNI
ncbi:hypothetical protein B0H17DRAFT_1201873 [Mycena rosella]|uniref:Uncharacterized protein n=1 Tax=Mycena rosella TaxID=1033263 RepID=A0AAD7DEX1_MYCRO|nr:hypothetical protein B0H17DRAFT_1201873 [Mycena rosella]